MHGIHQLQDACTVVLNESPKHPMHKNYYELSLSKVIFDFKISFDFDMNAGIA